MSSSAIDNYPEATQPKNAHVREQTAGDYPDTEGHIRKR